MTSIVITNEMPSKIFIWFTQTMGLNRRLYGRYLAPTPGELDFMTKKPSLPLNRQDRLWLPTIKVLQIRSWARNEIVLKRTQLPSEGSVICAERSACRCAGNSSGVGLYPPNIIKLTFSNAGCGRVHIRRPHS